jgi:hypothetical protein
MNDIKNDVMGQLTDHMAGILTECHQDRGMEFPFIVCAIAPNGVISAFRVYGDEREPDVLVDVKPGAMMKAPINVVIVSRDGDAARVAITASGPTRLH